MPETRFTIRFTPETASDLAAIDRKFHSLIRRTIDEQLAFEPTRETRNRKQLKRPTVHGATWELRFGRKTASARSTTWRQMSITSASSQSV